MRQAVDVQKNRFLIPILMTFPGGLVHACGFTEYDSIFPYLKILQYVFALSLFGTLLSVVLNIIGAVIGKFRINNYVIITLASIAFLALVLPFIISC